MLGLKDRKLEALTRTSEQQIRRRLELPVADGRGAGKVPFYDLQRADGMRGAVARRKRSDFDTSRAEARAATDARAPLVQIRQDGRVIKDLGRSSRPAAVHYYG